LVTQTHGIDLFLIFQYAYGDMSKRTYQPKKKRRQRVHGFLQRMSTRAGQMVLKRRRLKGRKRVAI
jgi:large subunit ribosomal protein L34